MTEALDNEGGTTFYYYDGDGRRVRRVITSQQEVRQVYGVGGELLAEYVSNAGAWSLQKEYGYRNGELLITAEGTTTARANFALRSNGATASASSELSVDCLNWPARGVIDGDRKGSYWGHGGGWADASAGNFDNDWIEITFNGSKTIDEVDVFTLQSLLQNSSSQRLEKQIARTMECLELR